MQYCHVPIIYPGDWYTANPGSYQRTREKHKPKSLNPAVERLVEELLEIYHSGTWIRYYSQAVDVPGASFLCRVMLLFWYDLTLTYIYTYKRTSKITGKFTRKSTVYMIGVYPGLGEMSEMCHSGFHSCHWCEQMFYNSPVINRTIHGDYRRWLPPDHPWRTLPSWGKSVYWDS